MTDVSLEASLSRGAGRTARPARKDDYGARLAARRREYRAYFALVLVLELPPALIVWALRALREGAWPERGPLRSARSQAAVVTSIILSA